MGSCSEVIQDSFSVLRSLWEGHLWSWILVASAFLSLQLLGGSQGLRSSPGVPAEFPGVDPRVSRGATSGQQGVEIGCRRRWVSHWLQV